MATPYRRLHRPLHVRAGDSIRVSRWRHECHSSSSAIIVSSKSQLRHRPIESSQIWRVRTAPHTSLPPTIAHTCLGGSIVGLRGEGPAALTRPLYPCVLCCSWSCSGWRWSLVQAAAAAFLVHHGGLGLWPVRYLSEDPSRSDEGHSVWRGALLLRRVLLDSTVHL